MRKHCGDRCTSITSVGIDADFQRRSISFLHDRTGLSTDNWSFSELSVEKSSVFEQYCRRGVLVFLSTAVGELASSQFELFGADGSGPAVLWVRPRVLERARRHRISFFLEGAYYIRFAYDVRFAYYIGAYVLRIA